MKKTFFYTAFCMLIALTTVSCSNDNEVFNPFDKQLSGEFNPKEITFKKSSDNIETIEKWSEIVRNSENKITQYRYTRSTTGYITENESRDCKIDYFTNHKGEPVIRTNTTVDYNKLENGIQEKYTEKIQEEILLNKNGYIKTISTTTDHLDHAAITPVTTTSERVFTYSGDFCTGSIYNDASTNITYKYMWSAYQLKKITILKEDHKHSTVDHSTYEYAFDTESISKHSGAETLPYIQSGFPQIFASMGYIGKFTPYVLTEEIQRGNTNYGDGLGSRPKTEIRNSYRLDIDNNQELEYKGASNIYDTYSLTFSK